MKRLLADLRAKQGLYGQYGARCPLWRAIMADGTSAIALYRLQHWLWRCRAHPLAWAVQWLNKAINGCMIGLQAEFGSGLVLIHPVGVVINSAVRGGRNVRIESGVVIGDNRGGVPVLGDDVFIGSGAKVIGGVSLGSRCRIGANAVVLKDVPAGATAVGIPAHVLDELLSPFRQPADRNAQGKESLACNAAFPAWRPPSSCQAPPCSPATTPRPMRRRLRHRSCCRPRTRPSRCRPAWPPARGRITRLGRRQASCRRWTRCRGSA
jgi:serine O-acetyltransferase